MASNTTNLNLTKPDLNDNIKLTIPALADNFDKIDASLAERATIKIHFLPVVPIATQTPAVGDCSLIVTSKGKTILIDTGYTESYSLIKNYLNGLGVTKIDYFIVSHYHPDHVDNLASLVADFDFSKTIAYLQKDCAYTDANGFSAHARYVTVTNLLASNTKVFPNNGDVLTIDDINIKFFNSSQTDIDYYMANSTNYNDYSMCCEVTHKNTKVLFTGDIHVKAQARINEQGYFKKVDLLKVHHHGADRDVNSDYIQIVQPKYSVTFNSVNSFNATGLSGEISTDTYNSGLRNPALDYFSSIGCKNYVIGYNGAVSFTSDGYEIMVNEKVNEKTFGGWTNEFPLVIYVDPSTTSQNNDGTYFRPFKKLQEAISFCSGLVGQRITIQLKDGTYAEDIRITSSKSQIKILGNSSDNSKVKVKFIETFDSTIVLDSVNIYDTKSIVVAFWNSKAEMVNCLVDGVVTDRTTYATGRGITAYNSDVYINGGKVANKTTAFASYNGAKITILNTVNENCDYVVSPYSGDIITSGVINSAVKAFAVKFYGMYSGTRSKGTTAERLKFVDSATTETITYYDTDLGKEFIWNGTAWVDNTPTVSTWVSPALENGATVSTVGGTTRYRTRNVQGVTEVEFWLSVQTIAGNTTFFTLPTGLRPKYFTRFPISINGASWGFVEVAADGTMKMATVNTWDATKYAVGSFRFSTD